MFAGFDGKLQNFNSIFVHFLWMVTVPASCWCIFFIQSKAVFHVLYLKHCGQTATRVHHWKVIRNPLANERLHTLRTY